MEKSRDPRLRAYVVWVPKYQGKEQHVPRATRSVPDQRARHYWDGDGVLLRGYAPVLSLTQDAWDVYLIYRPNVRWDGPQPPKPDYWMHQLGIEGVPQLDSALFADQARRFLTDH